MLSRKRETEEPLSGHQAGVLATHRPCHYAISNGRTLVWVARHTTCCVDAGTGQLTINIAHEPRWLAALAGAAGGLALLPAGAAAHVRRARTWIPELTFPHDKERGWPWFPVLELSFSSRTYPDCWPLARVRIYTQEPKALESALQALAQCSPKAKDRRMPASVVGQPGVAASAGVERAAVHMPTQSLPPSKHGATCNGPKEDVNVRAGSPVGVTARGCFAWLWPRPKPSPATPSSTCVEAPAAAGNQSARRTAEGAGGGTVVDALLRADRSGQRSAVDSSAGHGAAASATQVPPDDPSADRRAAMRRPKAAGAGPATSAPNRDSAAGPAAVDGRPARPVKAPRAQQPPAAPPAAPSSVRGPLRSLQLPSSSMAAFATSPAPLPLPPKGFTGPGAFGAVPGALPAQDRQAAAQGQAAPTPGAGQAAPLHEEAVRFRPDWTSIGQPARHASLVSKQLPQHGDLLDSARGTNGTCRKYAADGAAAAHREAAAQDKLPHASIGQGIVQLPSEQAQCECEIVPTEQRRSFTADTREGPTQSASTAASAVSSADSASKDQAQPAASTESLPGRAAPAHPCHAPLVPSTVGASAAHMPSIAAAQRDGVQEVPSSSASLACRAGGAAAAACPEDAAMASTAAGTRRPAWALAGALAGTSQEVAHSPDNLRSTADVSLACEHAASTTSSKGCGVSGVLADSGAAASRPGSILPPADSSNAIKGPLPLQPPAASCGGGQPAFAAGNPAAASAAAPSPEAAAPSQVGEADSHQPERSALVPVSLTQRSRSSGVVASAISALGFSRSPRAERAAQEAASVRMPQLCPQEFEAAWFCGPGRSGAAKGAAPVHASGSGMHSSDTPSKAAKPASPSREQGDYPMTTVQPAQTSAREATSAIPSNRSVQNATVESAPGAEAHAAADTVKSPTAAVAPMPEAEGGRSLEEHIVAARVRAFERAAGKPGATAPPALSAVRRERSPLVPGR